MHVHNSNNSNNNKKKLDKKLFGCPVCHKSRYIVLTSTIKDKHYHNRELYCHSCNILFSSIHAVTPLELKELQKIPQHIQHSDIDHRSGSNALCQTGCSICFMQQASVQDISVSNKIKRIDILDIQNILIQNSADSKKYRHFSIATFPIFVL